MSDDGHELTLGVNLGPRLVALHWLLGGPHASGGRIVPGLVGGRGPGFSAAGIRLVGLPPCSDEVSIRIALHVFVQLCSLTFLESKILLYLTCSYFWEVQNLNTTEFVYFILFFSSTFVRQFSVHNGARAIEVGYASIPYTT